MLAMHSTISSTNHDLIDMEMEFLSRLMATIESKQWVVLSNAILNNPEVFRTFARSIACSPMQHLNGMTILHACVRHDPPTELVKILLDLEPEAPACVDMAHRTPLHVAVGMRANISTVETLVNAYPDACAVLDWEGKTPLHLACDGGCNLFEDRGMMSSNSNDDDKPMASAPILPKNEPCHDTIQTLLTACPLAAVVEDQDGMTALEHAILSDASIKIVGLLQGATCRQSMKLHSFAKRISSAGIQDGSMICSEERPQEQRQLHSRRSQSL